MAETSGRLFAVGDITIDAFIGLEEAKVVCDETVTPCTITMRWGDKIPYRSLEVVPAVGNSPNAAVSASRLGVPVDLFTHVGDDPHGEECLSALRTAGVGTEYVMKEAGKTTNYHFVLSFKAERTILVRHGVFSYQFPEPPKDTKWLYLSSIGEAGEAMHEDVLTWLEGHTDVKLVFQPGTFQMRMGVERMKGLYERTHLFVCNREEAAGILGKDTRDIRELLQGMRSLGPKIVAVTDGKEGAYAQDEHRTFFVPQYPDPRPPKERTGAGDAFTSTLTSFLMLGYSLEEAL